MAPLSFPRRGVGGEVDLLDRHTMTLVYNKSTMLDRRRSLRQASTRTEEILWSFVRRNQREGIKFKRQYSVHGFVMDFYAPSVKLAIEIDGSIHDDRYRQAHDQWRQSEIEQYGIRFLRFSNQEILQSLDQVLASIDTTIRELPSTSPPTPLLGKERGA